MRYLHLLVEGGRLAGLSPSYLESLASTPCLHFEGVTLPVELKALAEKNIDNWEYYFSLDEVKQHDFNQRESSCSNNSCVLLPPSCTPPPSYWVTVGGWIFDVTSVVAHRAMLRKMSGADGTFYCLTLWATAFGAGPGADVMCPSSTSCPVVDVSTLSSAQREYVFSWLHHLQANYPIVGRLEDRYCI
jgi:hypothetical protein